MDFWAGCLLIASEKRSGFLLSLCLNCYIFGLFIASCRWLICNEVTVDKCIV